MKLSVSEKTGKTLQLAVLVVILALAGVTALAATGLLSVALLGGEIILFATIGAVLIACGGLMMLRKSERSISVGAVMLLLGGIFVILAVLAQFGILPAIP